MSANHGPKTDLRAYAVLTQVGFEMVLPLLAGLGLDFWLRWTLPGLTILGALVGLVLGVTHLVVLTGQDDATGPDRGAGG
jgi:hypothetical protein